MLSSVTLMFAVFFVGILQGKERPGVCSIMQQPILLILLKYAAASFHLPSVSTTNINTVQHPKPYQQYETPTTPAVVTSKVLLPQSNIMAVFVHSHSSLLSDVSPVLPTFSIMSHDLQYIQYPLLLLTCSEFLLIVSNCQHTTVHLNLFMPYIKLGIK